MKVNELPENYTKRLKTFLITWIMVVNKIIISENIKKNINEPFPCFILRSQLTQKF